MTNTEKAKLRTIESHLKESMSTITDMLSADTATPPVTPPVTSYDGKVGVYVGHSRSDDNGAVSVGGISEHEWNTKVAHMLKGKLDDAGVDCYVVDRYDGSSYGSAMTWVSADASTQGATIAIELHFNAASSSAKGYEYLYWHSSKEGEKLANAFITAQKAMNTPSPSRGAKPKDGEDRGSGFLSKTPCPAIILEPFFGSNQGEWNYWSERPSVLANVYAGAIKTYLKNN